MINSLGSKQLDILLPNTNKALAEALKSASPQELDTVSSSVTKDLKSMMSSILKKSATSNSSDKVLLDLVKNNPTLKNLGSVSATIKDLLSSLKTEKNSWPIEKTLEKFLDNIKDLKGQDLKEKLINPNVSLEDEDIEPSTQKILKNILSELKGLKTPTNTKDIPQKELLKNLDVSKAPINEKEKEILKDVKISQKDEPSLEKTIKKILTDAKDIKEVKEVKTTLDTKDISLKTTQKEPVTVERVIKTFLNDIKELKGDELKQKLNDLSTFLKTNLKDTSTSSSELKDTVSTDLKNLLSKADTKESSPIEKTLKNFLMDIKDLKGNELKQKFLNSGVFLESNLKEARNSPTAIKDIVTNDLKAILNKASQEIQDSSHPNQTEVLKQIDKLSLQIDNYQLISYLSTGSSLYLPLSWDQLKEGNIEIKKVKEDKFFCDINLKLKDFGDVNLKLALYDKNQLNLHIYSDNDNFKTLIKDNMAELRSALIDVKITPREIRLFKPKSQSKIQNQPYGTMDNNLQMGFEIKV